MGNELAEILRRIAFVSGAPAYIGDRRSLLHAYVACLSYRDLCSAIAKTIGDAAEVRVALRSRLLRLLREGYSERDSTTLVALVEQTAILSDNNKALRPAADALHSAVFEHLPLPAQQFLLDRWIDRGTRGAMARWLKATKEQPELFDAGVALAYWRSSNDERAAKSLAYQAPPEILRGIIPELVQVCEKGWIISKAVIRSGSVDEECWQTIRAKHPATYLYLCAQSDRTVTDDEAFALVCQCSSHTVEGGRGLAIWAVGQMGMHLVLDRVLRAEAELPQTDTDKLLAQASSARLKPNHG